jgi:hypothetical protein
LNEVVPLPGKVPGQSLKPAFDDAVVVAIHEPGRHSPDGMRGAACFILPGPFIRGEAESHG